MAETNAPLPPPITNVVVVMLENRSYDNVLGWLYNAGNQPPYQAPPAGMPRPDGLTGTETNVNPFTNEPQPVTNAAPNTVGGSGHVYPATALPLIDPNELFEDMAEQYLGVAPGTPTPWNGYPLTRPATMGGFMENYGKAPNMTEANIGDVMTYLTPEQMPVTSFLANQFGVCDQWFASVPTQTFTNRLFALCAAPQVIGGKPNYSVVNDADHSFHDIDLYPESDVVSKPSLLSQIDAVSSDADPLSWKLYFHDYSIALLTIPYVHTAATKVNQNNVSTFDNSDWGSKTPLQLKASPVSTFVDDVQNGTLPSFSFIEPRYNIHKFGGTATNHLPPNSNHPGAGNYGPNLITKEPQPVDLSDPPIDATGGELLLMEIYNLLQGSKYWDSTLLIVTYDEAGGLYDHVPPATGVAPHVPAVAAPTSKDKSAVDFDFRAYGSRVPAIIVSPRVASGSLFRAEKAFDHSSIVKTVWDLFDLSKSPSKIQSLTARDANAPSLIALNTHSPQINQGSPFSGTVVASPSSIVLVKQHLHASPALPLLASAGPGITLQATGKATTFWDPKDPKDWLTVTPISSDTIQFAPNISGWTISIDSGAIGTFGDATLTGVITISATDNSCSTTVGVTLYVS